MITFVDVLHPRCSAIHIPNSVHRMYISEEPLDFVSGMLLPTPAFFTLPFSQRDPPTTDIFGRLNSNLCLVKDHTFCV